MSVEVSGELNTDGLAHVEVSLRASSQQRGSGSSSGCELSDVRLMVPMVESATRLVNGFGWKGQTRPDAIDFRWSDAESRDDGHGQRGLNCRVWLGGADAGMQLNLQGIEQSKAASSSHCGTDDNGQLKCDDMTDAQYNVALGSAVWFNQNAGGATVRVQPRQAPRASSSDQGHGGRGKLTMLTVFTGAIRVPSAEALSLPFRLLLTPVRGAGLPRRADFSTRYWHMQRYTTVDAAVQSAPGAWIVLHQGNQLNPYINYPFLTVETLKAYVREAHAKGAKVKLYYTVRELSTSAVELWALRSLRGEVVVPSRNEGGHAWLREHVRLNYSASWHERLADGEVDSSVHTPAFTTRWDNYWIEGILWLVRNLDIDGIYLDGAPYERSVLRRLRAALEPLTARRGQPFLLDIHASCAGNPHLPYAELYPYLDSIWYGEQCDYKSYSPEQWLAEVSGVPFGLPGQVLGDNHEQWHGLLFGMTCRIYPDPNRCNPRPLWAALDALGLSQPRMIGWWELDPPVSVASDHAESVRATLYVAGSTLAIAVASWSPRPVTFTLRYDWPRLVSLSGQRGGAGSAPAATARLNAPAIPGFQPTGSWDASATLSLKGKGSGFNEGWLLHLVL